METVRYETVDSTNEAAKRLVRLGELGDPTVVIAREQTAGKGTRGRTWVSPRDAGIYLSVIDPHAALASPDFRLHTLAAGVACAEVLEEIVGLEVRLKPINDLYANGGKLGGILTEALIEENRVLALITGVGINYAEVDLALGPDAARPTSLQATLPPDRFQTLDADALAQSLARRILDWNERVRREEATFLYSAWRRHALDGQELPQE